MPHSEKASPDVPAHVKQPVDDSLSPSSYLGMRSVSPRSSGTPKYVSIAPYAETISPLILGQQKSVEDLLALNGRSPRRTPRSPQVHRLPGRRSNVTSPALKPMTPLTGPYDGTVSSSILDEKEITNQQEESNPFDALVDQVSEWIKDKRAKRSQRKTTKVGADNDHQDEHDTPLFTANEIFEPKKRRGSDSSTDSLDLDKLERIIKQNLNLRRSSVNRSSVSLRNKNSMRRLLRKQSTVSESDSLEQEYHVPSTDACLDNSKTLAYTGGGVSDNSDDSGTEDLTRVPSYRDVDAWARFKFEITRLAHTLRLKGWRKVPLEMSSAIEVQRLSGALTNAVYVVAPPADLPLQKEDENGNITVSKPPPKLLLRIYGPQVEHLIDREAELAILRRLARKHIGPRMLGTFGNGRFEEFLHAKPLTPDDLRDGSTSRQIAKRMRELHEGIELLDEERSAGAFVWRNWDKWLKRVEQIVTWMDEQVKTLKPGEKPSGPRAWMRRGYICGVPWERFRDMVQKYREWLQQQYGGSEQLKQCLVFAHNDTQYGNILRQIPSGDSPLLLPANTHKQLVVIDFEYASANTPGLEFANHFTEWCYNYHDQRKPYACNTNKYPKPEEQERFIRAYVQHRPQFNVNTPKLAPTTPLVSPASPGDASKRPTTNIQDFILDARTPQVGPSPAPMQEAAIKAAEDAEIDRLKNETRLWRLANTAQWVAWGLVQAKVPGMPLFEEDDVPEPEPMEDAEPEDLLGEHRAEEYKALAKEQQEENAEEQEEFDYLGYAQHRAMFFWGDAIQMGFVKAEDLPEEMRAKVKTVPL